MTPTLLSASGDDLTELLIWSSVALFVLLAFAVGVFVVRRKLLPKASALKDPTWTLSELNELHKEGRLSDAEYRVLKTRVIESLSITDR